ncbi:hypothetical protein P3W85_09795 [Cupriavidus basilensis]|uniref:Uncharacterized protein n=1 Tax=Cupriavidus basilensis TaxID=68895 RepID=A0ABT6AKX6_9BURK|nr:hypothetical protein [Cupriavidus basilensis]MDF3833236.1 hypothetical protein [Cupriavidus basilensis]
MDIVDIDSLVFQCPADAVGNLWRIEFDLASPPAWRVFAQFTARNYYDPEVSAQPAQFHVQTRALDGTALQPDLFGRTGMSYRIEYAHRTFRADGSEFG